LRATAIHPDGVTLECRVTPSLLTAHQTLHGGVYATIADAAAGMSIFTHYEGKRLAATVEMKVNYFLPVRKNGRIAARAHLRRIGSSLAVAQVDLTDGDGRLVGLAIVTYKLLDPIQ
jgi:acyl-CoA thioesterase